jgi:hypothetical protein
MLGGWIVWCGMACLGRLRKCAGRSVFGVQGSGFGEFRIGLHRLGNAGAAGGLWWLARVACRDRRDSSAGGYTGIGGLVQIFTGTAVFAAGALTAVVLLTSCGDGGAPVTSPVPPPSPSADVPGGALSSAAGPQTPVVTTTPLFGATPEAPTSRPVAGRASPPRTLPPAGSLPSETPSPPGASSPTTDTITPSTTRTTPSTVAGVPIPSSSVAGR